MADRLTDDEIVEMYLDTWQDSLIPLCANKSGSSPELCSEFRPALTNNGLCFSKNQGKIDEIYKSTQYIRLFKDVFLASRDQAPISKNLGSGMRFKYSFLVDANRVMDLKSGVYWNKTSQAMFKIALHQPHDMPDILDGSIEIPAGKKVILKVHTIQLESEPTVKSVKSAKRMCKFPDENDDLSIFRWYSR